MSGRTERAAAWIYRGVWGVIVELFKVPTEPPTLPTREGQHHDAFQPSESFLRYLKLQFWVALVVIDVVLTAAWIVVTVVLIDAD
ncbi:MAG: hypothetical protein JNK53_01850, partial [Phycisphaerae bacterium]|nr:hypothetical protein [Phycisphaerae bacterium]